MKKESNIPKRTALEQKLYMRKYTKENSRVWMSRDLHPLLVKLTEVTGLTQNEVVDRSIQLYAEQLMIEGDL